MKLFDRFGSSPHNDSIFQFIAYAGAIKMESYIKRHSGISITNLLLNAMMNTKNTKTRPYNMTSKIFIHRTYKISMFIGNHKKNITTLRNNGLIRQERYY